MTPVFIPESSCAESKAAAISLLKALKPDPDFRPPYDIHNGDTAWRFSDYCRRHGYEEGRRWTEHIIQRVRDIPEDCTLFTTYRAFQQAETQEHETNDRVSIPVLQETD